MSFSNISFILHKPQLSENIGACARALKNFNFKKLVVINPKPTFPNDKIIATSVGAQEVIKKSKVYNNLEPVIKNIDYLIATTSRFSEWRDIIALKTCLPILPKPFIPTRVFMLDPYISEWFFKG